MTHRTYILQPSHLLLRTIFISVRSLFAVTLFFLFGALSSSTKSPPLSYSSEPPSPESVYHIAAISNGFAGQNQAQQWRLTFDSTGVNIYPLFQEWSWGLKTVAYGYGTSRRPVEKPRTLQATDTTVTYQWDENLQEWWTNSANGLEQGFVVQNPPGNARGRLLSIEMALRGTLHPTQAGTTLFFRNEAGQTILRYEKLLVVDAQGNRIPAWLTYSSMQETIRILIDDRTARYPLFIDPWVQQAKLMESASQIDCQ